MVWIRWALSIFGFVIVFVSVQCAALLHVLSNPLQDSDFYLETLKEEEIYDFIAIEFINSLYSEWKQTRQGKEHSEVFDEVGLSDEEISQSLGKIIDPLWLQGLVENNGPSVLSYLNGIDNEFAIHIQFQPLISNFSREIYELVESSDVYEFFINSIAKRIVDESINFPGNPYPTESELVMVLEEHFSEEFVSHQINKAGDSFFRYLSGEEDEWEFYIPPEKVREPIKNSLNDIVANNIDEYIMGIVSSKFLNLFSLYKENFDWAIQINDRDIEEAIGNSLSSELLQSMSNTFVEVFVSYLVAEIDYLEVELDLREMNKSIDTMLQTRIISNPENRLTLLVQCGNVDQKKHSNLLGIADCNKNNNATTQLGKLQVNANSILNNQLNQTAIVELPHTLLLEMNDLFSADEQISIKELRAKLRDEFRWGNRDLKKVFEMYDSEGFLWENFVEIRTSLNNGIVYDQHDLKDDISGIINVKNIRDGLSILRMLEYLPLVISLGFAFLFGCLARSRWKERIIAALFALSISCFLVYILWEGIGGISITANLIDWIYDIKVNAADKVQYPPLVLVSDNLFSMLGNSTEKLVGVMTSIALKWGIVSLILTLLILLNEYYRQLYKLITNFLVNT